MEKHLLEGEHGSDTAHDAVESGLKVLGNIVGLGFDAVRSTKDLMTNNYKKYFRKLLVFPERYQQELNTQRYSTRSGTIGTSERLRKLSELSSYFDRVNSARSKSNSKEIEFHEGLDKISLVKVWERMKFKRKNYHAIALAMKEELIHLENLAQYQQYFTSINFASQISELKSRIKKYGDLADSSRMSPEFDRNYPVNARTNATATQQLNRSANNVVSEQDYVKLLAHQGALPPLKIFKENNAILGSREDLFFDKVKEVEKDITNDYSTQELYLLTTKSQLGGLGRVPFINISSIRKKALEKALRDSLSDAGVHLDIDKLIEQELRMNNKDLFNARVLDFNLLYSRVHRQYFNISANPFYIFALDDIGLHDAAQLASNMPNGKLIRDRDIADNIVQGYINSLVP